MLNLKLGGHRGLGCTDHDFYQDKRDILSLPVENTSDSIKAAFEQGADYIETDAVMSKDGVIFTIHNVVPKDHFFDKEMPPVLLNEMNFDDILKFQTGRHHNGHISTMKDILDYIATVDPKTLPWAINIEIKGVQGSGQDFEENDYLRNIVQTIHQSNLSVDRILFSSFSLENILRMSHALPEAKYGMLFAEFTEDADAKSIYQNHKDDFRFQYLPFNSNFIDMVSEEWNKSACKDAELEYVHPEIMTVSPDIIPKVAQKGLGMNVWALFEKLDDTRLAYYQNTAECATNNNMPFTVITDYITDMQSLKI